MERTDIKEALVNDLKFLRRHKGATNERIGETRILRLLAESEGRLLHILKELPVERRYMRCLTNTLGLGGARCKSLHMYARRTRSHQLADITKAQHVDYEEKAISSATTMLTDKICKDPKLLARRMSFACHALREFPSHLRRRGYAPI